MTLSKLDAVIGDLLDLSAAATELGLAPVTLRAAIARGRFAARKVGNAYLTTRAEVERYRAENLGRLGRPPAPPSGAAEVDPAPRGTATTSRGRTIKWSEIKRRKGAPVDD
jgi:Helix-turn-helix domain